MENDNYEKKIIKPSLSTNALVVLEKRYLIRDEQNNIIESPEDMFKRVAKAIAEVDKMYGEDEKKSYEEFYEIMAKLEFLPNSPTLMNAGTSFQQLSACFVLPVEDSIESIFESLKYAALIHKTGGGTGFSFSNLRPSNDVVKTTSGISSGPISFMKVYNAATEAIKQGGRRRGANMGILRIDHPDIIDFIKCKEQEGELANFNISVTITDEFMKRLEKNEEYELINPRTKQVVKKLKAKDVFDLIVEHAWLNGEPGVIFIDTINKYNPTLEIGAIESTNPCGEQPLLPYESCNLGSINLGKMIIRRENNCEIDWEHLRYVTEKAVHFLDNVIDANQYPIDKIREMTLSNRKIGLGIMGWADMLFQLRISYNSKEALMLAEKVMGFIRKVAVETSEKLAQKRGAFPNYEKSIFKNDTPRRNATLTTIAPTGSIGIIANASTGIEPVFALAYVRKNILGGEELFEVNPYFKQALIEEGLYSKELIQEVISKGSLRDIKGIPESFKRTFITAMDIPPEMHIRMQAAFQKNVDNAVSKTINLANSATKEDVAKIYLLAYKLGCKGVTVYRDGSRSVQVLNVGTKSKKTEKEQVKPEPRLRPKVVTGRTVKMITGCGNMYVTINEDEFGPCELFTSLGKSGGCTSSQSEAIGRLISLALRSGVNPNKIIEQLRGIRCPSPVIYQGESIFSCADAIAKSLEIYLQEKKAPSLFDNVKNITQQSKNNSKDLGINPQCPECGSNLELAEGCATCLSCGYSKCL
ncbi:MAG: vitamin B12-dependent ribonucleotide reductase [Endomicrobia bacterium]|nr:vitamin B12-dependent ribonucleotide reductase [Endomicrobiia bacterium]